MGMKKRKYIPKRFESKGEKYIDDKGKTRTDTSANIYESMLLSSAFISMTDRQRNLYIVCKAQYYGKRKPNKDYPEITELDKPEVFYLNWAAVQRYGLYKPSMSSNFYRDMQQLEEHGFIKKLASGKSHRTKNIYEFSSDWIDWKG